MVSADWALSTHHVASQYFTLTERSLVQWRPYLFTLFVLFFKDCDSSSGITNLRHTYGPLHIRLEMNTFCFKQIDGLLAKFLAL